MAKWSVQVQVIHQLRVKVEAENDLQAGDVAETAVSELVGDIDIGTWPDGAQASMELHAIEAIGADEEE